MSFVVLLTILVRWILSLSAPREEFHLIPGIRLKTRNGNHVTFLADGILKEFKNNACVDTIRDIYAQVRHYENGQWRIRLPNVEWGRANCNSITIERVGKRLVDAMREYGLGKPDVLRQVEAGINQLHGIGFAHCDLCTDNIFVDEEGVVFLGDLEYCTKGTSPPPTNLRRLDARATTAGQLDRFQFEKLDEELTTRI